MYIKERVVETQTKTKTKSRVRSRKQDKKSRNKSDKTKKLYTNLTTRLTKEYFQFLKIHNNDTYLSYLGLVMTYKDDIDEYVRFCNNEIYPYYKTVEMDKFKIVKALTYFFVEQLKQSSDKAKIVSKLFKHFYYYYYNLFIIIYNSSTLIYFYFLENPSHIDIEFLIINYNYNSSILVKMIDHSNLKLTSLRSLLNLLDKDLNYFVEYYCRNYYFNPNKELDNKITRTMLYSIFNKVIRVEQNSDITLNLEKFNSYVENTNRKLYDKLDIFTYDEIVNMCIGTVNSKIIYSKKPISKAEIKNKTSNVIFQLLY